MRGAAGQLAKVAMALADGAEVNSDPAGLRTLSRGAELIDRPDWRGPEQPGASGKAGGGRRAGVHPTRTTHLLCSATGGTDAGVSTRIPSANSLERMPEVEKALLEQGCAALLPIIELVDLVLRQHPLRLPSVE